MLSTILLCLAPLAGHGDVAVQAGTIHTMDGAGVIEGGGTLLIRDLFRPNSEVQRDEFVDLYAADASHSQRELFRASLHAAFTPEELRVMADEVGLSEAEVVIDSDRHMSLQLAARA